jgi:lysophospholipase L1-like esterase
MKTFLTKSVASLALVGIAACAGPSSTSPVVPSSAAKMPAQNSLLTRIVGVGDSLTAGYQSDGMLGETRVPNPIFSGAQIPPNQENGWWALLDEQASGGSLEKAIDLMYGASTSPLPLIKGPGLDNQVVPQGNIVEGPFGQFKGTDPCTFDNGFNQAGFSFKGSARVRFNPNATTIRDFGIPGITLHEANVIHQPQTDTCSPLPGIPGLLSDVVNEESGMFWPVLRNFTRLGGRLTEVNAAASVHPTLATVWLGANDVLKYMGSGGRFVGGDRTVGQVETDLRATISTLQSAGARVVIANLPNILETGYFQRMTLKPVPHKDCALQSYASCIFFIFGTFESDLKVIADKYGLVPAGGCIPTSVTKPCGYLTLAGALLVSEYGIDHEGAIPDLDCPEPAPGCKVVPGSGLGANYITPAFAAKVQQLNNVVNQGIDGTATATHVPMVDVYSIFHGIASGDPKNPYFAQAASINPGVCCTLGFLYGVLSFDGIHPSNTGYALIAYDFIATINKAYGAHIPEVDVEAVYKGDRCSDRWYCFPDPFAPPNDISDLSRPGPRLHS